MNRFLTKYSRLFDTWQGLRLIDFGRGIDTTLFPQGTLFKGDGSADAFQCVEMLTKRPWTYQVSFYLSIQLLLSFKRTNAIFPTLPSCLTIIPSIFITVARSTYLEYALWFIVCCMEIICKSFKIPKQRDGERKSHSKGI